MNKLTKGAFAMVLAGSVTFSVTNALLADQPLKRLTKAIALPVSGDQKKADVISKAEKTMKEQTPTTNVKDGQTKLSHKQVAYKNITKPVIAIKANKQNTIKLSKSTTTIGASTDEATTATIASKPTETTTKRKTTTTVATTKPATNAKAPTTTKPATNAKAPTTTKPATSAKAPTTTKPATSVKAPTTTKLTTSAKAPTTTKPATSAKAPTITKPATKPTGSNTKTETTTTTNRGQQVSQEAKEKAASHREQKENNVNKM
jgi:hypothetical protein